MFDCFTEAESTVGEKTKRAKVKEAFSVSIDESVDLDWHLKVTKAATTVTRMTLEKHNKRQTTLPEDLHYDANQLMKLSSMPSVMASSFLHFVVVMLVYCCRDACLIISLDSYIASVTVFCLL